ncbi:MAG: glutamine amidotransferase [Bacteroidales bacterium]
MAKIFYAGDWAVLMGPMFAESPFNYEYKGIDIFNYGEWLVKALESDGRHEVLSLPSWEFYKMAPGQYEQILEDYDLFIFSDIEAKNFQLAPSFFNREKMGKAILTFPDRTRLTVEAVNSGKPAMFLGGWLSFSGETGKGGWGRTRLKEVLPVNCLKGDDLIESTEGFYADPVKNHSKFLDDIYMDSFPPILGYNQVLPREDCEVILNVKGTVDPLLATGQFGKGRTLAYMSDPAPHWGCNFVYWEQYNDFWLKCVDMLLPE